ncbi:outer membrane lipoprotein LolB [Ectothiorhodosinus mongolicus]|uniref:Outer-membrane lipoprotein LolB n=1 Tax=Ectothiorhodosinus mongolicus TaxID=233100 RepID=A0A1R3W1A8_9GAMM|nr:lipoprotein insertase outer membrane protein LolB [Ectothiorhodosinus mongolicus]ULX57356.1 outer membrane lipoprotein LolB [Ectothiorhodosinus mongolicus]SIT71136.1 outer membrane lipoprotein LolB [Ectothiorhodosinus mongolicus]
MRAQIAALGALVLLSACASLPQPPAVDDAQQAYEHHVKVLLERQHWTLTARVAVHHDEERWHANLRWQQNQDAFDIQLYGPLGRQIAHLQGNSGAVLLRLPDGQQLEDSEPSALMQQAVGWSMPVAGMRYWLMGLSAPQSPIQAKALNEAGLLQQLAQQNWTIQYERYQDASGQLMPQRLQMQWQDTQLRLVADSWEWGR